jgi:hypothetical protein
LSLGLFTFKNHSIVKKDTMRLILFFLLCLWSVPTVSAQKFIQLEKANRARTIKFYVGQEITYRLKSDNEWHIGTITNARMDSQLVALDMKQYRIADIDAIRLQHPGLVRNTGRALMVFGTSWAGFSLIGAAFDDYKLTAGTAIVSGTSLASGFILHRIFRNKNVKLNDRRRLRAVEIPVMIQR